MKSILFVCLICTFFAACEPRLAKSDSNKYLYYYAGKPECGEHVFVISGKYKSVLNWHEEHLKILGDGDSIFNTIANRVYYKEPLKLTKRAFDTIQIANSMTEIRSGQIGWLYNLEICEQDWSVSLYYPFENIKGTYQFEISDSENQLLMSIVDGIVSKFHKYGYFPERDTIKFAVDAASAIYLNTIIDNTNYEYFSSLNSPPCDFSLLNQLVIIIVEEHVNQENKVGNTIKHLNIRDRFNYYKSYDRFTGSYVEDFDSVSRHLQQPD